MLSSCTGGRSSGAEKSYGSKRLSSNGFNQHHHQSRLELLASSSSDNLDNPASGLSSDQSCRSLFSGQHLGAKLTITDDNNNTVASNHFINAGGSIFALAGADQAPVNQRQTSYDSNIMLEQVSSSSSPALPRPNKCQQSAHQQQTIQQRRLQYQPIHQKLQRIYGNKLQEFEQQRQNQHHNRHQLAPAQPLRQRTATIMDNQEAQSTSHKHNHHEHARQQQFHPTQPVMHHHHHHSHDHQEQTYDSLSPPVQSNHKTQHRKQQHQHFFVHNHQQINGVQKICAIPEEQCNINHNQILVRDDDDRDELIELDDEELSEQEGQLARPIDSRASKVRRQIKPALVNSSSVLVEDRKKHLESLHYATATAAALLNVTASAAAAFAASEKQLNRRQNRGHQQPPTTVGQKQQLATKNKPLKKPQIYSETYQDINQNQHHYKTQHPQYQPVMQNGRPVVEHPMRSSAIQPAQAARNAQTRSISLQNQQLRPQQKQQEQVYNLQNLGLLQARGQPPIQIANRQAQLPRITQMAPLTARQVEILRQQRQLQKSQAQIRLTNSAIGGQQALAMAELGTKIQCANLDPRFLAAQHALGQLAANRMQSVGNHNKQQVTYGLLVAQRDKKLPPQQQQIYVGPLLRQQPHLNMSHLASGASSEASVHTNLPLILDRRLRPVGFIEKICQIDLTVFWWTLLIICVIFIATVVTITRYVF